MGHRDMVSLSYARRYCPCRDRVGKYVRALSSSFPTSSLPPHSQAPAFLLVPKLQPSSSFPSSSLPPHSQPPAFLLVPKLQLGNALDWKLQLPAAGSSSFPSSSLGTRLIGSSSFLLLVCMLKRGNEGEGLGSNRYQSIICEEDRYLTFPSPCETVVSGQRCKGRQLY
jgi:hypothetical protein